MYLQADLVNLLKEDELVKLKMDVSNLEGNHGKIQASQMKQAEYSSENAAEMKKEAL